MRKNTIAGKNYRREYVQGTIRHLFNTGSNIRKTILKILSIAAFSVLLFSQSSDFQKHHTASSENNKNSNKQTLPVSISHGNSQYDRKIVETSAAWGVLTNLIDGSIGLMYQKGRPLGTVNSVNVSIEFVRSTDGGETWGKSILVHERLGSDGELFERTPDSGYVVFQSRNIAMGQLPSGRIVGAFMLQDYHYSKNGDPVIVNDELQSNWDSKGIVYTWSDDYGATWASVHKMTIDSFSTIVVPHWRIICLNDGTAIMSFYGIIDSVYKGALNVPNGTRVVAGVTRSRDNGETWGDISLILTKAEPLPYEETALVATDKNLQAFVRTPLGNVVQYVSVDDGYLWKGPVNVTDPGQHPGGAFQLKSGKMMMTWGNRKFPFGAAAMLSNDSGKTWDHGHQVSLGWDSPNQNCGYANGIQLADGTILVTYYSMPANVEYRNLWSGSVIYIVKFTEEQFLAAKGQLNIVTPTTPQNLTAISMDGKITLHWNKIPDRDFLRYRVYSGSSSPATTLIDSTRGGEPSDTSKIIINLQNDSTYYFSVTAVDSTYMESDFSNEISVKPSFVPTININVESLSFGDIKLKNNIDTTIFIYNTGNSVLFIDSIYASTKLFNVDITNSSVAISDTLHLKVSFRPNTFSEYFDTLYFLNNSTKPRKTIPLYGRSSLPKLVVKPLTYNIDTIAVGDSTIQYFFVSNNSINDLEVDSIASRNKVFQNTGFKHGSIKSKDSASFSVVFKPTTYGEFTDTLFISSFGDFKEYNLGGFSPFPEIKASLSSLDFVNLEKDSITVKNIVIKNSSINKLKIDSVKTKSKYYEVQTDLVPIWLSKKDSLEITVIFTPDSSRSFIDTLSIYSNTQSGKSSILLKGKRSLTLVENEHIAIPKQYVLEQNFPNPFNPSTVIRYGLPGLSSVSLKIYNVLGQLVANLANAEQVAGWNEVIWNANVSSGLYFCKFDAVSVTYPHIRYVDIKKLMLIR